MATTLELVAILFTIVGPLYASQFYLYRQIGRTTATIEYNQKQIHKHLSNPDYIHECDLCSDSEAVTRNRKN